MRDIPVSAIEMPTFLKKAERFFDDDERAELVFYIASNPEAGHIMPESGGVRKLRWGVEGRGKSGGVRVIYYFHNDFIPLFLLDLYAKNEKANLSKAERNEMKRVAAALVKNYEKRNLR